MRTKRQKIDDEKRFEDRMLWLMVFILFIYGLNYFK